MSRGSKEDNHLTRWSEPILRKRCGRFLGLTSDEEVSSTRRSASSSPLLDVGNSVSRHYYDKCCTCRCNTQRKYRTSKKTSDTKIRTRRIRESLELHVIGTQVEEALSADRQAALIQHLDLATNTLEALMQHVRSLHVSHLASSRVFDFAHRLVLPDLGSSDFHASLIEEFHQIEALKEIRLARLKSAMEICAGNITASERLQSVINENETRRDNFSIAARNFKCLLDDSRLSISQMEKLQKQYESILVAYRQSRRALDVELPKVVRTRLEAIGKSLRIVSEFYGDFEYGNRTADFIKIISENLCPEEPVSDRVTSKAVSPEVCQKCRANRIDEQ